MQSVMFYIFASAAIMGAARVISARNPVHSILFLVLVFFNAAGMLLLLGAEFIAMMLVIVYVGAVAVLFLFVIMILDINVVSLREGFLRYLPVGGMVGTILLVELITVVVGWTLTPDIRAVQKDMPTVVMNITNTEALGRVLYTDYMYLFQTAGVVLLVAMVGSIMLALRPRVGVRKQVIACQLERTKANSLDIRKVPTREGI